MYTIKINDEIVGNQLSKGELNQWIIELEKPLTPKQRAAFRKSIGFGRLGSQVDFEDFLYEKELKLPVSFQYNENVLYIHEIKAKKGL